MSYKGLFNTLCFTYSPMSSYEFDAIRTETEMKQVFDRAKLYMICRRPLIEFTHIKLDQKKRTLSFKLKRKDISSVLTCEINFELNENIFGKNDFIIEFGSNSQNTKLKHAFKIFDMNDNFIFWANPEKLIYLASHNVLKMEIKGNAKDFMRFEVLYVGKCTDESIIKRFKSHHALLKILIEENIVNKDYDKAHEILIIPFELQDNQLFTTYDFNESNEIMNDISNPHKIDKRTIALDAEKALIKTLDPRYNEEKFHNYPKSSDGLYNENLNSITYSISEDVILQYKDNLFIGDINPYSSESSFIGISNENVEILNTKKIEKCNSILRFFKIFNKRK